MLRSSVKVISWAFAFGRGFRPGLQRSLPCNGVTRRTFQGSSIRVSCPSCRFLCDQAQSEWTDISYPLLKTLLAANSIQLIDVRQPEELAETGKIGDAINIPLGEVEEALNLSEAKFAERYQAVKPGQDSDIVFTCLGGVRSRRAMNLAHALGYADARHYVGGWQEWAAKELGQ